MHELNSPYSIHHYMFQDITCNWHNCIASAYGHRNKWCECMVDKSTLRLVLIGWARLNGTTSNRVARLIKMVKKIRVRYQQKGIDPLSGENPLIMVRHSPQR